MRHRTYRTAGAMYAATFIIGMTAVAIPPRITYAATAAQNIIMSPASVQVSAKPGQSVTGSFDTFDAGTEPFNYKVYAAPYRVQGQHYDPSFTSLPGKTDASTWLTITSNQTGTIKPKKHVRVTYTLSIPKDTAPGGYYAVLFAETIPDTTAQGVATTNRVGNILYITAEGAIRQAGSLQPASLPPVVFGSSLSLPTTVANTGGTHFTTTAYNSVTSLFGSTVFQDKASRYVLPETKRTIDATWKFRAPFGVYRIKQSADILGKRHTSPDRWIFVMQWWALAVLAAGIVLTGLWQLIRRRYNHKKEAAAHNAATPPRES